MKILLLSVNSSTIFYRQLVIPFGLASIGSYVSDEGYTIKGIEMNAPPEKISDRYLRVDDELLDEIIKYKPDLVAMSTYAENIFNVFFWSEVIKGNIPSVHVVIGGNHVSYMPHEALEKCKAVDFVVKFEGEIPFRELCRIIINKGDNYEDVPNLVYRKNGEIHENKQIDMITDLDSLPILNRGFFSRQGENKSLIYHADIITARGCPFHCTFCDCNHYWRKKYRTASIDRVIHELKILKEQYPNLKSIRIRDETVSVQKKRCLMLTEKIVEQGIELEIQAHSRLDGLDEEIIKNLSLAGFKQLYIGLESGSQEVLDRLQKGIKIENVYKTVTLMRKYNINFRFSLMIATPEETLEDSIKTIQLVNDLDLDFHEFYFGMGIIIYPGTTECDRFLAIHPDFKWFEVRKLHENYQYALDINKNPVGIYFYKQKYSIEDINKIINKILKSKLAKYYETDYNHLRQMEYVSRIRNHHFKSDNEFYSVVRNFFQKLDKLNPPWCIAGNYTYYKNIMKDVVDKSNYKNYDSFIPLWEKEKFKRIRIKKGIKYLIVSLPENEVDHYLPYLKFRGDIILFDKFIINDNLINSLNKFGIEAIMPDIKKSIDSNRLLIKAILKKLKLLTIAQYMYDRIMSIF